MENECKSKKVYKPDLLRYTKIHLETSVVEPDPDPLGSEINIRSGSGDLAPNPKLM